MSHVELERVKLFHMWTHMNCVEITCVKHVKSTYNWNLNMWKTLKNVKNHIVNIFHMWNWNTFTFIICDLMWSHKITRVKLCGIYVKALRTLKVCLVFDKNCQPSEFEEIPSSYAFCLTPHPRACFFWSVELLFLNTRNFSGSSWFSWTV